jgi:hypothetical protein
MPTYKVRLINEAEGLDTTMTLRTTSTFSTRLKSKGLIYPIPVAQVPAQAALAKLRQVRLTSPIRTS